MTAANNGASTPEDDDPFGYLYEDGQAAGATPPGQGRGYGYPGPAAQPGVPRTSYNQVRTVGERQYGGPQQQYGQQVPHQQAYGQQGAQQPTAHYAAPETYPGGAPTRQTPQQQGGGRSGGPNTRGLLIGAVAVVAVVVIGIAAALMTSGDKDDKGGAQAGNTGGGSTAGQSVKPSDKPKPEEKPQELPKQDAATLKLGPPAALATDIKGAEGADGAYVTFNGVGGSASWSVDVPEAGEYTMFITYSVPGKDAKTSLTINGQTPRSINMSNFAKAAEGDWEKGWTRTYAYVNLQQGKNDLKISCEQGDQCEAFLDQVALKQGQVGS
ncbi:carbohydrate-binding protein [Streptomyces sp. NBC_01142]|uniref:CBM35 domain-containing protein n=1 Tax=Streptomyces sp. NBC_01142 TaxID=2975865 RepID=UPI00225B03E5|nr:CBM35 domain-containing protein [Streptomyces sp. NBC_01142]MCX4824001.1 carbohydrate-binding protein [Streptomyces sp. NBC_01142]